MTAPFVSQLRVDAAAKVIRLGAGGLSVRVQVPEVWDAVRLDAGPSESVLSLKHAALEALYPEFEAHEEWVMKLNGWEVLDESVTLTEAGARNGSTFLLTHRRRRPVR